MEDETVFRGSAANAPFGLFVAAALLLGSLAVRDPMGWWLVIFLAGGIASVSLGRLANRCTRLSLGRDGFDYQTGLATSRMHWRDIEAFRLERFGQDKVIVVKGRGRLRGGRQFDPATALWIEGEAFIPNLFEAPLEEVLAALETGHSNWLGRQLPGPP